jgi:phosphoglycerol transferase MdoB-like AlkP superfamily enzyme
MKHKYKYISNEAVFWLTIVATMLAFDALWRLIFLIRNAEGVSDVPIMVLAEAFQIGSRFDMVGVGSTTAILFVLSVLPGLEISRRRWYRRCVLSLLTLVTAAMFLMQTVDLEFYSFFGQRLNGMILTWRDTPGLMMELAWEEFSMVPYTLLWLAMVALFVLVVRKLVQRLLLREPRSAIWVNLVWLPFVVGILLIGARGRVAVKSPIRSGVAYFSEYNYANQLALSPVFTFWRDAVYDARDKETQRKLIAGIDSPDARRVTCELLSVSDSLTAQTESRIRREVRFGDQNDDPPNIILIIMESFGSTKIGALDNRWPYDLSPNFDAMASEGVLFTNFYSSGMHTYTGIFSSLTGSPHQFTYLIMKQLPGLTEFHSLASVLSENDYATSFYIPHDAVFDNLQGFVGANGFARFYSTHDFDAEDNISMWGVPDHVLFDRAVEELSAGEKPFFATIMTCSNHGPWVVPEVPFDRVPDSFPKAEQINAFKYSDWSLGQFVRAVMADSTLTNTYIVITSDNGTPYDVKLDLELTYFQAPLLILDTDRRLEPNRVDRLGSQFDLLATIMGLVRLDYEDYSFGHDLLDTTQGHTDFAHFSEWYKIGYIEGEFYLIHRLHGGPRTFCRTTDPTVNLFDSLPDLADKYEQRAKAVFKTAYYNQMRPIELKSDR